MLSAKKRAALGDVSNRCFGRPAADALASFYKDADTSSLLLAPDIHLLILEHVGAPAYVVTAGVSKSWREAVLIKLRAAGVDCRADVADPSMNELVFTAPPALAAQVTPGMKLEVSVPGGSFTATVTGSAAAMRPRRRAGGRGCGSRRCDCGRQRRGCLGACGHEPSAVG